MATWTFKTADEQLDESLERLRSFARQAHFAERDAVLAADIMLVLLALAEQRATQPAR